MTTRSCSRDPETPSFASAPTLLTCISPAPPSDTIGGRRRPSPSTITAPFGDFGFGRLLRAPTRISPPNSLTGNHFPALYHRQSSTAHRYLRKADSITSRDSLSTHHQPHFLDQSSRIRTTAHVPISPALLSLLARLQILGPFAGCLPPPAHAAPPSPRHMRDEGSGSDRGLDRMRMARAGTRGGKKI